MYLTSFPHVVIFLIFTLIESASLTDYIFKYGWVKSVGESDYPNNTYLFGNTSISSIPKPTSILFFAADPDDGSNELLFDHSFADLEKVYFSPNSEKSIRNITIDGVPELQSITFGRYSCCVSTSSRNDGWLTISNSPKLMKIEIHNNALQDYSSVVFTNLSSLQTISIGNFAFQQSLSFELQSMLFFF